MTAFTKIKRQLIKKPTMVIEGNLWKVVDTRGKSEAECRAICTSLSAKICQRSLDYLPENLKQEVRDRFISGVFDTATNAKDLHNGEGLLLVDEHEKNVVIITDMPKLSDFHVLKTNGATVRIPDTQTGATNWLHKSDKDNTTKLTSPDSVQEWLWVEGICKQVGQNSPHYSQMLTYLQQKFRVNLMMEVDASRPDHYDPQGNFIKPKDRKKETEVGEKTRPYIVSAQEDQIYNLTNAYKKLGFKTGVEIAVIDKKTLEMKAKFECDGVLPSVLVHRVYTPEIGKAEERNSTVHKIPRRRTIRTPRARTSTPRVRNMTPRARNMTPRARTRTPRRRTKTPRARTSTPRRRTSTPRRRTRTPRRRTRL
jgi:hypothetical protein